MDSPIAVLPFCFGALRSREILYLENIQSTGYVGDGRTLMWLGQIDEKNKNHSEVKTF
jgi:hypothetical protein